MRKNISKGSEPSRATYEVIEEFVRFKTQEFIQDVMEEEVTEFFGRKKSERKGAIDAKPGYRNGLGRPRRLSLMNGTITIRRPRLRQTNGFESKILPLFKRRTKEVGEMLPELYLHGLANGDFELALRGLLGDGAPLSASSIQRLKAKWQVEYEAWKNEDLSKVKVVYQWADGIYVKAGLEKEKAALLVIIGATVDSKKRILACESGYRESKESWQGVLRGLIPYAETQEECERLRDSFISRYEKEYPKATGKLMSDWERMVTFYSFPKEHWLHIRTTNVVESPFSSIRLRTDAARRFKRVDNATAMIWKLLMVAEKNFRMLNGYELLPYVYAGCDFKDGVMIVETQREERTAA